ncbi:MAG: hypothetical protein AB7N65_24835, partial [Vicinamibacterales bacterium]
MTTRILVDGGEQFVGFAKNKLEQLRQHMRHARLLSAKRHFEIDGVSISISALAVPSIDQPQCEIRIAGGDSFYVLRAVGGSLFGAVDLFKVTATAVTATGETFTPPTSITSYRPYIEGYYEALFDAGLLLSEETAALFFPEASWGGWKYALNSYSVTGFGQSFSVTGFGAVSLCEFTGDDYRLAWRSPSNAGQWVTLKWSEIRAFAAALEQERAAYVSAHGIEPTFPASRFQIPGRETDLGALDTDPNRPSVGADVTRPLFNPGIERGSRVYLLSAPGLSVSVGGLQDQIMFPPAHPDGPFSWPGTADQISMSITDPTIVVSRVWFSGEAVGTFDAAQMPVVISASATYTDSFGIGSYSESQAPMFEPVWARTVNTEVLLGAMVSDGDGYVQFSPDPAIAALAPVTAGGYRYINTRTGIELYIEDTAAEVSIYRNGALLRSMQIAASGIPGGSGYMPLIGKLISSVPGVNEDAYGYIGVANIDGASVGSIGYDSFVVASGEDFPNYQQHAIMAAGASPATGDADYDAFTVSSGVERLLKAGPDVFHKVTSDSSHFTISMQFYRRTGGGGFVGRPDDLRVFYDDSRWNGPVSAVYIPDHGAIIAVVFPANYTATLNSLSLTDAQKLDQFLF